MRVGVKHAALGDLVHHAVQQHPGQFGAVQPAALDQRLRRAQVDPVQPFDNEHVLGGQPLMQRGQYHRGAVRGASLLARPGGRDRGHIAGLHPEIEFFPHGGGEPANYLGRADRAGPPGAILKPDRQAEQDVQVLFDGRTDPWPLDLHRHLGAQAVAVTQPGPVNLGNRCGGGRLGLKLGEDLLRWRPH